MGDRGEPGAALTLEKVAAPGWIGFTSGMSSPAEAPEIAARPVTEVLWMLLSGMCLVAVTGIVRYVGTDLPAAQAAFIRFTFGVLLLASALLALLRAGLPPGTLPLFALRGMAHVAAVILWFYAVSRLPVAEATAIGYLTPVVVTLGAALIYGERLAPRRVVAVLAGWRAR